MATPIKQLTQLKMLEREGTLNHLIDYLREIGRKYYNHSSSLLNTQVIEFNRIKMALTKLKALKKANAQKLETEDHKFFFYLGKFYENNVNVNEIITESLMKNAADYIFRLLNLFDKRKTKIAEAHEFFRLGIENLEVQIQTEENNLKDCQDSTTTSPFGSQEQEALNKAKQTQEIREIQEVLSELKNKLNIFTKILKIISRLYYRQEYLTEEQTCFLLGYAQEREEYAHSCHRDPPKICGFINRFVAKFSPLSMETIVRQATGQIPSSSASQSKQELASRMNTVLEQSKEPKKEVEQGETKADVLKVPTDCVKPPPKVYGEFLTVPKSPKSTHRHQKGQKRKHLEIGEKSNPIAIDEGATVRPTKRSKVTQKK